MSAPTSSWMAEWLTSFIESDPEVSERDLVVLDHIREQLEAEVPDVGA